MARDGQSGAEIARELSIAKATVSNHLKRHFDDTGEKFIRPSAHAEVQRLIDSGLSCREAATTLGISKMTITHAINRGDLIRPKRTGEKSLLEYTTEWHGQKASPHFRRTVRKKLVSEGYCAKVCAECGLEEWRGQPAPLELDHIDGDPTNNRISNLRIICLHCHTQTPTFGWRNIKSRR